MESDSVLQRNKILLEHVIYERKKFEEISSKNNTKIVRQVGRRAASVIQKSSQESQAENPMVFIKNEAILQKR